MRAVTTLISGRILSDGMMERIKGVTLPTETHMIDFDVDLSTGRFSLSSPKQDNRIDFMNLTPQQARERAEAIAYGVQACCVLLDEHKAHPFNPANQNISGHPGVFNTKPADKPEP